MNHDPNLLIGSLLHWERRTNHEGLWGTLRAFTHPDRGYLETFEPDPETFEPEMNHNAPEPENAHTDPLENAAPSTTRSPRSPEEILRSRGIDYPISERRPEDSVLVTDTFEADDGRLFTMELMERGRERFVSLRERVREVNEWVPGTQELVETALQGRLRPRAPVVPFDIEVFACAEKTVKRVKALTDHGMYDCFLVEDEDEERTWMYRRLEMDRSTALLEERANQERKLRVRRARIQEAREVGERGLRSIPYACDFAYEGVELGGRRG